jgi:hypothetical protein
VIRTAGRWLLHALWLTAAAFWPFTGRYTSFGCEWERHDGGVVHGEYWRLRWPSDGAIVVARLTESRPARTDDVAGFDVGGTFLQPPRPVGADGFWSAHGFWWVSTNAASGPMPAIVAGTERAAVVGIPHWLLTISLASAAACHEWRRARRRRDVREPAS